jgi:hypothetical protein
MKYLLYFLLSNLLFGGLIKSSDYAIGMEFGSGLNSLTGELIYRNPCLKNVELKQKIAQDRFTLEISQIKDDVELERALGVALSLTIGYAVVEVTVAGKFANDKTIDSKNTYYLIKAEFEKDSYSLKKPEISEEALSLYLNKFEGFRNKCGDQYIDTITTGAKLYALIEIKNKNLYEKRDLEAKASVFIGKKILGKNIGVEIAGTFSREIEQLSEEKEMKITFLSQGVEGSLPLTIVPEELFEHISGFVEEMSSTSDNYRENPF